ncbi:MAG: Mbeg1-like protein, partial [Bradyrhizobium guangdongense]
MSILVELHPDRYDPNAFARFNPASSDFDLDVARAIMWMSQLAYETHVPDTITKVSGIWKLNARSFIQPVTSTLPLSDTRGVIAEKDGATIVAFAGTDPLLLPNWISDFHVDLLHGDVHGGFEAAAAAVWDTVKDVLAPSNSPVFITGHSLGAALAVLTADHARRDLKLANAQVYLYGC